MSLAIVSARLAMAPQFMSETWGVERQMIWEAACVLLVSLFFVGGG